MTNRQARVDGLEKRACCRSRTSSAATAASRSSTARRLKVDRGQIVALLGGNGTGKSTLLKATSGLIKPWSGSITFDGERIDGLAARHDRQARPRAGDAGQGSVPRHDGRGEPEARRLCRQRPRQDRRRARARLRLLPDPEGKAQPAVRHAVRRPAADGVHRPRPDVVAEDDHAGRAERRACPADRAWTSSAPSTASRATA